MARSERIKMLGERAGAAFAAWHINADFTVSGVTLYECNDQKARIPAKQGYTARGSYVWLDTTNADYFSDQQKALEAAYERARTKATAAHEAYIKASAQAREARDALNAYATKRGPQ